MRTEHINALYKAIQTRPRPEDVADLVADVLVVDAPLFGLLHAARRRSVRRMGYDFTSMKADFARPTSMVTRQIGTAEALMGTATAVPTAKTPMHTWPTPPSLEDVMDPVTVIAWIAEVGLVVGKLVGANDFRTDRQLGTKAERRKAGIHKNARWINKRWRVLKAIEVKLAKNEWNDRRYRFTRIGKSAFATTLTRDEVAADAGTSCLIAYLSARMGLRSTFTNAPQVRAFDAIAEGLLARCERSRGTRWDLIARVMPDPRILCRLSQEARGRLIGQCWETMREMAQTLHAVAEVNGVDRRTMIVARGNDSSTWNQVALGWNQARRHWVALLHASGAVSILDAVCPGKVMRLMAADVAAWHRESGGDVHPDSAVWAALPPPWDVVTGRAICTRAMVEDACADAGVKPETWTSVRDREAVAWAPTPELVHGVTVASGDLGAVLRRSGAFSGKKMRAQAYAHVQRDANGFALYATDGPADDARFGSADYEVEYNDE